MKANEPEPEPTWAALMKANEPELEPTWAALMKANEPERSLWIGFYILLESHKRYVYAFTNNQLI